MKGNNREIQRQRIEDGYIEQIDSGRGSHHEQPAFLSFLEQQEHHEGGPLRVPIFELLVYKASLFDVPLKGGLI